MAKSLIILFCALLAVSAKNLAPRDLADEALEQIAELNSLVGGEILVAHDDLGNLITEFGTNSLNIAGQTTVDITQQYQGISEQLDTIKNLANSVNVDISSCTNVREDVLNRMPVEYAGRTQTCITVIDDEATRVTTNAIYTVDVVINKVNQLDFQVRQCRGDILCISPLVTEIELDKIRLPQNIKTEVQASDSLLTTLRISVQSCSDDNVAEYTTESYNLIADITTCANRIIG